jgi:hypothetical protein
MSWLAAIPNAAMQTPIQITRLPSESSMANLTLTDSDCSRYLVGAQLPAHPRTGSLFARTPSLTTG